MNREWRNGMKRFCSLLLAILTLCLLSSCGGKKATTPVVTTPIRGEGEQQTQDPRPVTSLSCFEFTEDEDSGGYKIAKKMGVDLPDRIVIPSHYKGKPVTGISSQGFAAASNLVAVDIPSTFIYGGIRDGSLPTSVTELTCSAKIYIPYDLQDQIKKLTLTDGEVSGAKFSYSDALEELTICSGVTEIWGSAFSNCRALKTVTFEEGVTYIGAGAFGGCRTLGLIVLPDSLTEIDCLAFKDCITLQAVTIGKNLKKIGSGAFTGCGLLQNGGFVVDADNEYFKVVNGKLCDIDGLDLTNDLFYDLGGK